MRVLLAIVMIIGITGSLTSCFDPPKGEISVIATKNGQRAGCGVQLFNSKGNQIDQVATDMQGLVYIKNVMPGRYTLKFIGPNGKQYPAVVDVTIDPGEQEIVRVDLNQQPAVPE